MDDEGFDRLLRNCRLMLSEGERSRMKADVDSVIGYFGAIDAVDCSGFEEAHHPVEVEGRLRPDEVFEFENADAILKGTRVYRFYILGPMV